MTTELNNLWKRLIRRFTPESKAAERLKQRGHDFVETQARVQLGYFPGSINMEFQDQKLRLIIKNWRDKPALVYPLRTAGGYLCGIQLEKCSPGKSERDVYLVPGAEHHGVFFYTDDFDWEKMKSSQAVAIVEGCYDNLSLSKFCSPVLGLNKAFASEGQIRVLERWCRRIYDARDNDETGDKAHATLVKKTKGRLQVTRIRWPKKDPQELYESGTLENVVRTKLPAVIWKE